MYQLFFKRVMDIIFSLLGIVVFLPILVIIGILVKLEFGSPILFKQKRVGIKGKIFTIYKFRTMTNEKNKIGDLLPDEKRLTKFGEILRNISLDELPQLFNVLKGEMSIIGPRPLLIEYLPLYNEYQRHRHDIKPGLSGLEQINAMKVISWEDKFELDIKYVNNVNFIDDWKIVFLTLKKIISGNGTSSNTKSYIGKFEVIKPKGIYSMKKKLIIIGASGHGKVAADIANKMNKWENIWFLDDDTTIKTCLNYDVIGTSKDVNKYKEVAEIFVAIGNNKTREKIQNKLQKNNFEIAKLIHPQAIIGANVNIGRGTIIMAGVVINPDTTIKKGCIINTGSTLDHENTIEDFVHISPGVNLAGNVKIGKNCWIGIGSKIINNTTICENTIVGAGAVVLKNIEKPGTYIGVPSKIIFKRGIK